MPHPLVHQSRCFMRRMLPLLVVTVAAGVLLLAGRPTFGQGDDVGAIIDKAIAAHGLKGKQDKTGGYRGKNKGTLHVNGMNLEFTQNVTVMVPDKFKEAMDISVMGMVISTVTVFDGKAAWITVADKEIPVKEEMLD